MKIFGRRQIRQYLNQPFPHPNCVSIFPLGKNPYYFLFLDWRRDSGKLGGTWPENRNYVLLIILLLNINTLCEGSLAFFQNLSKEWDKGEIHGRDSSLGRKGEKIWRHINNFAFAFIFSSFPLFFFRAADPHEWLPKGNFPLFFFPRENSGATNWEP